jgi:hypothetical protein
METMTVLDRLMQTEGIRIQLIVINIVNQIVSSFPDSYFVDLEVDSTNVKEKDDGKKHLMNHQLTLELYKIFKVLFNVFLYYVPGFVNNAASACMISI